MPKWLRRFLNRLLFKDNKRPVERALEDIEKECEKR